MITIAVVIVRRRAPYLLVGWLWYLVMLLPVIGIVQVGLQGHADRYTYLPHIGLIIAVVWSVAHVIGNSHALRTVAVAAAVGIVSTLSAIAYQQTGYWKSSRTLWQHTLDLQPNNDVAHAGLAGILLAQGDRDAAMSHFERAIQLRPGNAAAQQGLATAYMQRGDTDAAIDHFQRALEILPDNVEALNQLGVLYATKGAGREAIKAWRSSVELDHTNADAYNNLAWIMATDPDENVRDGAAAVQYALRASELTGGNNALALRTLAVAYAANAQFITAVATAERAADIAAASGDSSRAASLRNLARQFRLQRPFTPGED